MMVSAASSDDKIEVMGFNKCSLYTLVHLRRQTAGDVFGGAVMPSIRLRHATTPDLAVKSPLTNKS